MRPSPSRCSRVPRVLLCLLAGLLLAPLASAGGLFRLEGGALQFYDTPTGHWLPAEYGPCGNVSFLSANVWWPTGFTNAEVMAALGQSSGQSSPDEILQWLRDTFMVGNSPGTSPLGDETRDDLNQGGGPAGGTPSGSGSSDREVANGDWQNRAPPPEERDAWIRDMEARAENLELGISDFLLLQIVRNGGLVPSEGEEQALRDYARRYLDKTENITQRIADHDLSPDEFLRHRMFFDYGNTMSSEDMERLQNDLRDYARVYLDKHENTTQRIADHDLPPAEYAKYQMFFNYGSSMDSEDMARLDQDVRDYTREYLDQHENLSNRIASAEATPEEYARYQVFFNDAAPTPAELDDYASRHARQQNGRAQP